MKIKMNKILSLNYESSLTNLCEINSSFDKGILRICYTGENRNCSYFSKESLEKNIKTIYNCPIVCNYSRDDDSLGGHDISVVEKEDNEFEIINLTQPVGVIPESAKVWFDNYEEEDGTIHEYLYTEALLWKRQEAYEKIKKDGITKHSMEVAVKSGHVVDGVLHIEDFEFTAFALIGVEPCFESSALEMFSSNTFKDEYLTMMNEVKNTLGSTNTFNKDIKENDKEGGQETLDNNFKDNIEEIKDEEELKNSEDKKEDEVSEEGAPVEENEGADETIDDEEKKDEFTDSEEVEALKEQLMEAEETIAKLEEEIAELKDYKDKTEAAIAEKVREEILDEFVDLNDKEEFNRLRKDASKFDLETLKEKCFAIRGKYASNNVGKFSNDGKSPKLPVDFSISKTDTDLPYNGIVEKYAKR